MEFIIETERLYLRKINRQDIDDLFEMDSDPEVHKFIENNPVSSKEQIAEVVDMLNRQYEENGIARWAVVEKQSLECIGWAGLKYFRETVNNHKGFYELGYRFKQKHWGKGYATEASKAIIEFGFKNLGIDSIFAITHPGNKNSIKVLEKSGFELIEQFDYDGDITNWFELVKTK
jgi:ribosomal-protein-alanine N-acetyltransferase